jgi:hypothetical protein
MNFLVTGISIPNSPVNNTCSGMPKNFYLKLKDRTENKTTCISNPTARLMVSPRNCGDGNDMESAMGPDERSRGLSPEFVKWLRQENVKFRAIPFPLLDEVLVRDRNCSLDQRRFFIMKKIGVGYDTVPAITYFSGSCHAGPQEVLILHPGQSARPPILSRLVEAFGRSIRFLMGPRE